MSARGNETPIFKQDAVATLVSDIPAPAPDPRRARVSRLHAEIVRQVKTGDIYRPARKSR